MKTTILSARVVALFMGAILITFIPENYPEFFGDYICKASANIACGTADPVGHTIPRLHWGYRHYLFFTMGLVLFIIQIFSIANQNEK